MFDPFGFIAPAAQGETRVQPTAGGAAVVDQGNASQRIIAPSGTSRGLSLNSTDLLDSELLSGRVTLGLLEAGLIVLVLGYIWTRNVQGGG